MQISQQIFQKAKAFEKETADTLSELVRIPSLSGEEESVIQTLSNLCHEAGFDEVRIDGLGNLVCSIGSGSTKLAIDAHVDTVDTGNLTQWEFDPFSGDIKDGYVYGRGSVDQKGGAASMITAGRILKELDFDEDITVYFTFTIMEEDCDGMCWNYLIEKENITPDFAVITEPTNLGVYRGHRGRMEMDVFFKGVSSHGSAPERGENALYKAAETVLNIRELHNRLLSDPFLGKGSIAVTSITSQAPSLCAVPDSSSIHIDRRLTWGETMDSAIDEVTSVSVGGTEVEIPVYEVPSYKGTLFSQKQYFPTWKLESDHYLVKAGEKTFSRLFQVKPVTDKWTFSTNGVAICGKHGIPCIGFGPGDEVYAHAPNEKTPIEHLVKAAAFYAQLPYVLIRE